VDELSAPRTKTRQLAETEKHEPADLDLELAPMRRPPSPGTLQVAGKLIIKFGPSPDDMTVELRPL
jgi:hypothetical protein